MGAIIGTPTSLVEFCNCDDKWGMMSILSLILTIIVTLLLCTWRLGRLHTIE
ncbi:hypothetical protein [Lysinibacillus sp. NPDC056185]|uniref:hypothetical protein n=1 Tax=Lysinibacillus sp. NPDC056185 TaxID=3345739 RepID=UPI0039EE8537